MVVNFDAWRFKNDFVEIIPRNVKGCPKKIEFMPSRNFRLLFFIKSGFQTGILRIFTGF